MKEIVSLCLSMIASVALASSLLLVPPTGDPTLQAVETSFEGFDAVSLPSLFFGGEGVTGVTYTAWIRWTPGSWQTGTYCPFIDGMVSYESARATKEGGAKLANLIDGTYMTNDLPLVNGTWSTNCLTAIGNLAPNSLSSTLWQYGCFCVNYRADTAFTMTVGGAEKYCEASDTNVIFNIQASTISRDVSIAAESTTAHIKFGIAHNPLIQFVDIGTTASQADRISVDTSGIVSNEWRMISLRARIDSTNIITKLDIFSSTTRCLERNEKTEAMWHPTNHFAVDSRVRMCCSAVDGWERVGSTSDIRWYAPHARAYWVTDATLELWRDLDYIEIQRRGMSR